MSINIKIQKKDLWLLAAIFVFLVGVGYVIAYTYSSPIPNPGHGGDNVFININGSNTDLQTAINNSDFASCSITGSSYSLPIIHGHRGEEIIVNINGTIKSLQQAINDSSIVLAEAGTSPSNFGNVVHGETGDKILININGTEKTLQEAINEGDFYACAGSCSGTPEHTTGYSIYFLGREEGNQGYFEKVMVNNSLVVLTDANFIYSTTQGNWLPVDTYNETLRLNITGERATGDKDANSGVKAVYRIYGNQIVAIKSKTWAQDGGGQNLKLNRLDTFERQNASTILINGNPQTIASGETYQIQIVSWKPPGCGGSNYNDGKSYVRVTNDVCTDYFDVTVVVREYDEECDSAWVKIESYIEPA